ILIMILTLKGTLMAIEEPKYTLIEKNDTFEIREYAPYVVAQTKVTGTFDEMGKQAFSILFKYISGENKQRSKIKMTAPVIQESSMREGQKISMTAPVIQEMDKNDKKSATYSFVMPETFKLDTLPLPLNKRITLKEIPAREVAVLQYSGSWSEKRYKQNEAILFKALDTLGITTIGKPIFARYNSPFALWFMRRNEIMIEVQR
ncbi:MAG: heme-binding protein, partial [Sulfurovum sp.]|nr:heme-binding protein [Sulfurovum sp.]